ncbi:MAG: hypothetical protein K2P64_12365 [Lachnospiraceae bacterium]|nr:hypothetical protein [Lachnospiraceae bacterium]
MYQKTLKPINKEDKEAVNILVREIIKAIDKKVINCDRTFKTAVRRVTPKGYVIADRAGGEHTVKCSLPDVELKTGQLVWAKEPMGDIKGLHICGVTKK